MNIQPGALRFPSNAWMYLLFASLLCSTHVLATPQGIEPTERDFYVPRAGYKRTVDLLALRREVAMRVRPGAPGPVTALTGSRALPTILVEFDNRHGAFEPEQYQEHLFGDPGSPAPQPTMSQYYVDLSLGALEVNGHVVGWFHLPQNDTHYEGTDNGNGPPFGDLLEFGLQRADEDLDFGEFDNDGPDGLPNSGDDDGFVDTVFFVHAEVGGECRAPGQLANVWSHSWHYSEPEYDHSGPFVTQDVQLDENQLPQFNDDGTEKRIRVEDYTIQPGLACPDGSDDQIVPIGVFTHEYGHALGLPDLYDRTPNGNADSLGIGSWSLMAAGSWGFNQRPETPTRLDAWSLARLGWANLQPVDPSAPVPLALEPVQERNLVYVIDVPNTNGKEYFLIELKDPNWEDALGQRLNWDQDLPDGGLAIWHVDDNVGATSLDWPFAPHDKGQNDSPSVPNRNKHSLVALEEADCKLHLEKKTNAGDAGDLWKNGVTFGQAGCQAGSVAYDGTDTGLVIDNIDITTLTAELRRETADGPEPPPAVAATDDMEPAAASAQPQTALITRAAAPTGLPPESGATPPRRDLAQRSFEEVNEQLAAMSAQPDGATPELSSVLDYEHQETLLEASAAEIEQNIDVSRQKQVKSWVAQERHYEIDAAYEPQSQLEEDLVALRESSDASAPIQAQVDPSQTRVEQVTGLRLPAEHETNAADSADRLDNDLRPLIGEDVDLRHKAGGNATAQAQRYEQVYEVDGTELPVFSKGVALYYDEQRNLTAVSNKAINPSELDVKGSTGQVDMAAATRIVVEQLGVPEERLSYLKDAGEGIYLVDGDPEQAHVVRRLLLPVSVSATQADLAIYIDQETGTVIGIE